MKILAIRIKNLASLEGITEIDFTREPLKSAGVFAITGPTGAGKSTILDALCLALYAKTPRYAQATENVSIRDVEGATINQKDVRAILRDGTAEGWAEVDFIGIDNNHYTAGWYVRRAGGKPEGKLQTDTVKLENITTRTTIPGKKKEILEEIERLAGLSFEQFTRSVLLAQGDFTAFLKAGKDEKASLLEKLTGISIYSEISTLVFEKHKQAAQELQLLQQEVSGISLLENDTIQEYKQQETAYRTQITTGEQQLAEWKAATAWWQTLDTLKENADQALLHWNTCRQAWQAAAERQTILKQIEAVQVTRRWIENIRELEAQQEKTHADTRDLTKKLEALESEKTTIQHALDAAEQALEEREKEEAAAAPLMEKALELDVLLKERKEQLEGKTQELATLTDRYRQLSLQLERSEITVAAFSETIATLTQWQEANRQREAIADNASLIVSKLTDAGRSIVEIKEKEEKKNAEEKRMQSIATEKVTLEKDRYQISRKSGKLSETWQQLREEIQPAPGEALEEDLKKNEQSIERLRQTTEDWNDFYRLSGEYRLLEQKLSGYQSQQQEQEIKLQQTNLALKETEIQKQTSETLVKKALLQVSGNIEQLRETLEEGQPCPVCGSTEHPYAHQHPMVDKLLKSLEAEHAANEKKYEQHLQTIGSLQQQLTGLHSGITETQTMLSEQAEKLAGCRKKWETHIFNEPLPEEELMTGWLQEKMLTLHAKKNTLQAQLESLSAKRKKAEELREQLIAVEKDADRISNKEKDADRNMTTAQQEIARLQQEKEKARAELAAAEALLSPYFTGKDWIENWKSNPGTFVQKIRDFAGQWKTNRETLEKTIREHGILSAAMQKEETQVTEAQHTIREKEAGIAALQSGFDALHAERKKIFEGTAIKLVEQDLATAIAAAQETVTAKKEALETLLSGQIKTMARLEQLQQLATTQLQQKAGYEAQVADWLFNYNRQQENPLDREQLTLLLVHTHAWIEEERKTLKALEDDLTRSQTAFEERKKILIRHEEKRVSDKDEESLTQLIQTEETTLEKQKDQLNEIRLLLRQDEESRKRTGHIQKQITQKQTVADNWGKLNDLVGSADGKKFRQVAQEYTLEVLIMYANQQLNSLSGRYTLQRIPDSLSLQVIDRDMGNEIRTIYSLSGGESFLVSLALALGLASLSSSQVQVESLFIDEGFGSLDPITLATVMDALDRLHDQGRKVGVISHVEEMTERIPVQIKVSRLTSGRSKVETDNKLLLF